MALMKKRSVLCFVMLAALVATRFPQLHASNDFPVQDGNYAVYSGSGESGGEPCCDMCVCTRSLPPKCRCSDIKPYCPFYCKTCLCNLPIPPRCQCTDVKDHCDKKCTPPRF